MNWTSGSAVVDRKKGVLTIAQLIREAEDKKRQVSILSIRIRIFILSLSIQQWILIAVFAKFHSTPCWTLERNNRELDYLD
jgi:hypothetical protein